METQSAVPSDILITRGMTKMVGILFVCLLAACSNGSVTRQPGPGAPFTPAVVCTDVDVAKLSALYVSPQGSDDGLCSAGAPCKTMSRPKLVVHKSPM